MTCDLISAYLYPIFSLIYIVVIVPIILVLMFCFISGKDPPSIFCSHHWIDKKDEIDAKICKYCNKVEWVCTS